MNEQQEDTATPGETFHYQIKASGAPTFSLLQAPAGMTIHPVTGQLAWLPVKATLGNFKVTVLAANTLGSNVYTFTVKVTNQHHSFLPLIVTR